MRGAVDPQAAGLELTVRRCAWCGGRYVAPKWSRPAGCRECCPTLEDAIAATPPEHKDGAANAA